MIPNTLPKSLVDNPMLASWIGFEEAGRVRVATGKVELGQGILTTLAQIAAEELDVDVDSVRIASGITESGPAEDFTSGSNSTSVSGAAIRLVAAEVRALFLGHLATVLGCPADELAIENGHFLRVGEETGQDYWSLATAVILERRATGTVPPKRPEEYRIVGRSRPRLDLADRITGAPFVHDLAPAGLLHARILHRPWRGAALAGFDEAAVRRSGGVEIIREGDLVTFLSPDQNTAVRAWTAARSSARWTGGDPPPDTVDDPGWLRRRPARSRAVELGAPPSPGAIQRRVEATYSRGHVTHGSIAPSCAVAAFDGRGLKVWTHSQGVFVLRNWLARALALDPANIRVFHTPGAGCYGHNSADDAAFEAAFLALRRPGRPIRVQWTREDEFGAAPVGPASVVRLEAGLGQEGRPIDWTVELWSPVHGRRPGMNGRHNFIAAEALEGVEPEPAELDDVPDEIGGGATRNAEAYYDLPRHRLVHHLLDGVPVRTSTIRALGAHLNVFAIESFVDELAEAAGEDPLAYRLALTSDERARRVIESAADMADWASRRRESGSGRGFGLGFGRYKNWAAYMAAVAEVAVDEEVRVLKVWAAVDAGLIVNPDGAASQIEGGIVQATSWTVKEQLRFSEGRTAAESWSDYPILRFSETPAVEVRFTGSADQPTLGIGEAAVGPTAASIGNAVAVALGARIRSMPLSRERILDAILGESA